MKKERLVRIGVLLFALSMFTSYVVHSQLQQTRKVASSSKSIVLADELASPLKKPSDTTNPPPVFVVFMTNQPDSAKRGREMYFPGSKSSPVFTPAGVGGDLFSSISNLFPLPDAPPATNPVAQSLLEKPKVTFHPTIKKTDAGSGAR